MKLKMMLLAMCVCGGTSLLLGNSAEESEAPKTEDVKTTSEDNVTKADVDQKETKETSSDCGCSR